MKIKYRVIEVNEKEHSFIVRYYTDSINEDMLASQFEDGDIKRGEDGRPVRCRTDYNLTLFNVAATEEDIDWQIQQAAPADWINMMEQAINIDINDMKTPALNRVLAKIHIENEFVHEPPVKAPPPKKDITDTEIELLLEKVETNRN